MQNKPDYPRICYVLGGEENPIKPGEKFEFGSNEDKYYIDEKGDVRISFSDSTSKYIPSGALCAFINNPEKIRRLPSVSKADFSADEIGFMRVVISVGYLWIARDGHEGLYCYQEKPTLERETFNPHSIPFRVIEEIFPQITHENSPIDMRLICGEAQNE